MIGKSEDRLIIGTHEITKITETYLEALLSVDGMFKALQKK